MRIVGTIKDFLLSKHIQLAFVSGASIIVLAYVSRRVLTEPMDKLYLSIPAFLVAVGEGMISAKKKRWYTNANLWIASVVISTVMIISFSLHAGGKRESVRALEEDLQEALDGFLAGNPSAPGLSAAVICPPLGLDWYGGAGSMSKDGAGPMTPDHTFRIASNTKTYVAASVLRLAEMDSLDIEDSLSLHLPAIYDSLLLSDGYDTGEITIKQVLSHTAGLGDHTNDSLFVRRLFGDTLHIWTPEEQIRCLVEWREPVGKPGERYEYSDAGYVILGTIISSMTGKPLGPSVRDLLDYEGLGLTATYWEYMEEPPPGAGPRAHQYFGDTDVTGWHASFDLYGGGGIVTDSKELALFMRSLLRGEVLEEDSTLETMTGTGTETYRLGLMVTECGGTEMFGHQGFWNTFAFHAPELDLTVAGSILNHDATNGRELMCRLVGAVAEARGDPD